MSYIYISVNIDKLIPCTHHGRDGMHHGRDEGRLAVSDSNLRSVVDLCVLYSHFLLN